MRNKLTDLNNHLFAQLERLNDEELQGEELLQEINRSKAITNVSQTIINNAGTILNASKILNDRGDPILDGSITLLLGSKAEQ